jgi:hypothetical protein
MALMNCPYPSLNVPLRGKTVRLKLSWIDFHPSYWENEPCYRLITIKRHKTSPASLKREIIARQLLVVCRYFIH